MPGAFSWRFARRQSGRCPVVHERHTKRPAVRTPSPVPDPRPEDAWFRCPLEVDYRDLRRDPEDDPLGAAAPLLRPRFRRDRMVVPPSNAPPRAPGRRHPCDHPDAILSPPAATPCADRHHVLRLDRPLDTRAPSLRGPRHRRGEGRRTAAVGGGPPPPRPRGHPPRGPADVRAREPPSDDRPDPFRWDRAAEKERRGTLP